MKNPEINFSSVKPLVEYLQKQRENEKFFRSIESVATLMLISFFLFFAIKPTVFTISSLVGEIKSKETLSKSLRNKIGQVVEAQDVFSQVQERYFIINSALPDNPRFTALATQIVESGRQSDIPITQIDYRLDSKTSQKDVKIAAPANMKNYSVSSNVETGYPQILDLLQKLDNNRRLVTINQIILEAVKVKNKDASPSATGNLSATINAQVYYWLNSK